MRAKHMRHVNKIAPKLDDHVTRVVGYRIFRKFNIQSETLFDEIKVPSLQTTSESRQFRKRIKRAVRGMSHRERGLFYAAVREEAEAQQAA